MLARLLFSLLFVASCANAGPLQADPQRDYRVLVESQPIAELWPQLAQSIAKNSESGLHDRIAQKISSSSGLSPDARGRAVAAIPSVLVAARTEFAQRLEAGGGGDLLNYLVLTVYPKYITPTEASTLAEFYRSATGAKMLRLTPVMIAERRANPAADPFAKHFTSAEIEAVTAFARQPAAQKMNAVAPQVREEMNRYFADRSEPILSSLATKYAADLIAQVVPSQ
jgi:hypothetical protein